MVDTTSADHIAAKRDTNLQERTFALAEGKLDLPQGWVEQNWGNTITEEFDEEGNTMVSGLAYAIATYKPTPLPGANRSLFLRSIQDFSSKWISWCNHGPMLKLR